MHPFHLPGWLVDLLIVHESRRPVRQAEREGKEKRKSELYIIHIEFRSTRACYMLFRSQHVPAFELYTVKYTAGPALYRVDI